MTILSAFVTPGIDAQLINREYQLKAVYLYSILSYAKWPASTCPDDDKSYVIGILGTHPVEPLLHQIASKKKVNGRTLTIRSYAHLEDIDCCHILFTGQNTSPATLKQASEVLKGRHVLRVGEGRRFLDNGGTISFVVEDNRVKIYVSQSAAARDGVEVSSKLLRIAVVAP